MLLPSSTTHPDGGGCFGGFFAINLEIPANLDIYDPKHRFEDVLRVNGPKPTLLRDDSSGARLGRGWNV